MSLAPADPASARFSLLPVGSAALLAVVGYSSSSVLGSLLVFLLLFVFVYFLGLFISAYR